MSGPGMPEAAAPRPIALPFAERYGHAFLEEEVSWGKEEEEEGSTTSLCENEQGRAPCTWDEPTWEEPCWGAACAAGGRSFQRLLCELAAEHRRALEQQRRAFSTSLGGAAAAEKPLRKASEPQGEEAAMSPSEADDVGALLHGMPSGGSASSRRPATLQTCSVVAFMESGSGKGVMKHQRSRLSPFDFASESPPRPRSASKLGSRKKDTSRRLASAFGVNDGEGTLRRKLLVRAFDVASTVAIVLNSATIGWGANTTVVSALAGGSPQEKGLAKDLSLAFTLWFSLEILVRLLGQGCRGYFAGPGWTWNVFDVLVVGSDVAQCFLELLSSLANSEGEEGSSSAMHNLTVVRMLRILRITRALRILRIVRFFRELRMMVLSVLRSYSSLLWSLVLLGVTIYVFAVYFVQIVAFHVHSSLHTPGEAMAEEELALLKEMFGNLLRAEYTLYMSVSGGISWGEVSRVLIRIDAIHGLVFCFFTFFTTFALLNIITGIFVETSISSARSSQEELAQEQLYVTRSMRDDITRIFQGADKKQTGSINLEEFEVWLESKEVRAYLDALGIEVDKAKSLFELLDLDMSGEITAEEFTFGCMRLKGWARSIDLATLMTHTRRMADQWRGFVSFTEHQFQRLQEFESRLEDRLGILFDDLDPGAAATPCSSRSG